MTENLKKLEKDFEHEFITSIKDLLQKTQGDIEKNLHPTMIPMLADIAAIYSGISHLETNLGKEVYSENGWNDEIADELKSAEEKYREYQASKDSAMLEMARDELKHASYYLNRAKMSTDMELREKAKEYQKKYDELAVKLNSPHGTEKIGRL
jgi:hypothetical protein